MSDYDGIQVIECRRCRVAFVLDGGKMPDHDPKTCKPWPAGDGWREDMALQVLLRMPTGVSQ